MTRSQTPASDEPTTAKPAETNRNQQKRRKSTKSETIKAEVLTRRCQGESKASIAREVGIDRSTVDTILEEVDIGQAILEAGLTNRQIVNQHLVPLLSAEKGGLYGGDDNATRLRAIKLIMEAKGIRLKPNGNQDPVRRPQANPIYLVVADERRAAKIAGILSPSGAAGVVVNVDAKVDEDLGREGHGNPVQTSS